MLPIEVPQPLTLSAIKAATDDAPLEEITSLFLEVGNLRSFHFGRLLDNLMVLNLSNNAFVKIENFDSLTGLRDLNLSFNRIEKIENLNALVRLEKLSLYGNRIREVENLEGLTRLQILDIGRNDIQRDFIPYLGREFPSSLLSLNAEPIYQKDRNYVIVYLPSLLYLNYVKINPEDKLRARSHYPELTARLESETQNGATCRVATPQYPHFTRGLPEGIFETFRNGNENESDGIRREIRAIFREFTGKCEANAEIFRKYRACRVEEMEEGGDGGNRENHRTVGIECNFFNENEKLLLKLSDDASEHLKEAEASLTRIFLKYRDHRRGSVEAEVGGNDEEFRERISENMRLWKEKLFKNLMRDEISRYRNGIMNIIKNNRKRRS